MLSPVAKEIVTLVDATDFAAVRSRLTGLRPPEIASLLVELAPAQRLLAFRAIPREPASRVFDNLPQAAQRALVKTMAQEDVAALLNNMAPDDRTLLFEELPANVTKQLLSLLTPEERAEAVTLLGYPAGSIGRLMTPDYIAVREDWTVQQVLDYVRAHGQDSETLNVIYVVDDNGLLIDDIRMREFLLATARQARLGSDGPPVRRAEGDRRPGSRRSSVPRSTTARRCP